MILRLTTVHENSACRAGACPGLADASVGPTICAAAIFMVARNPALVLACFPRRTNQGEIPRYARNDSNSALRRIADLCFGPLF